MLDTPESQVQLVAALRDPSVESSDRHTCASSLVATALAYSFPLPAEAVDSPRNYYQTNFKPHVARIVGELNERVILDTELVLSTAETLWMDRFRVAFIPNVREAISMAVGIVQNAQQPVQDVIQPTPAAEVVAEVSAEGEESALPTDSLPVGMSVTSGLTLESYMHKHMNTAHKCIYPMVRKALNK